ncbi:hypothetical protein MKW98_018091 [Papaver atlanticum]|uniref:Uncharacterized protein n=1 Tax=Papaver atlanticum TaxID=357466 RepID=A0AAD4TFA3_9MAGN|nr:hypothetical protein MKW98_018091 [Papaver atlanticum]
MSSIKVGDVIPVETLGYFDSKDQLHFITNDEDVNDPCVMNALEKTYTENKHIKFPADGSAAYTNAFGLDLDLGEKGIEIRSRRFALLTHLIRVFGRPSGWENLTSGSGRGVYRDKEIRPLQYDTTVSN